MKLQSIDQLRCPACHAPVTHRAEALHCTGCALVHPIVDDIPIMLNEANSVCRFTDYTSAPPASPAPRSLGQRLRDLIPQLSRNHRGERNYARLAELLRAQSPAPRVLVVGGRVLGKGMEAIMQVPGIEFVETDVELGPRVQMICDAHDLPFTDASFDGVIIQAVLEHVCSPPDCVAEIHRVLKPGGLVYAETPFMQQVHGGAYDFTRFTDLGHRRLFRRFAEIDRGACCGPGMALAWSVQYFLLSLSASRVYRALARISTELALGWLPVIDRWLIDKPHARNASSGHYFMGRRSEDTLSDRDLIGKWVGMT
jgi:SAM-dependent methyltransferase